MGEWVEEEPHKGKGEGTEGEYKEEHSEDFTVKRQMVAPVQCSLLRKI